MWPYSGYSQPGATMDSPHTELELNAELTMCMNEAQATKAVKKAEVSHATKIKEAELHHTAEIKEAEVCHTATIKEVKLCHTTRIKVAEACHTTDSCVLQQTHRESRLTLKHEAIAEKGWDCLTFVEASIAAP